MSDLAPTASRRARRLGRFSLERGPKPVRDFFVLSVVLFATLGLLLSSVIQHVIRDRYLTMYGQSAEVTVSSVSTIVLSNPSLESQLRLHGPGSLFSAESGLAGVAYFAPDGSIISSALPTTASGPRAPASVRQALVTGRPVLEFTNHPPAALHLVTPTVELAVPVYRDGVEVGVVHAFRPAAGLQHAISTGEERADLVLALGLAMAWLLLFPVVLAASRRLRRQALRDALTGLPNRELFADRIAKAMAAADRRGEKVGLLLLDLDRFKEVNDSLGHKRGDELLRKVATALATEVRASDTLARLGGDEFAIVLAGIRDDAECATVTERLLAALEIPVVIEGVPVTPQASIGISIYPDHGSDAEGLLSKADIAMYSAKVARHNVVIYRPEQDFSVPARLGLVTELRRALSGDEILCYYQPVVRTSDGGLAGYEALVRWAHPTRGLLGPEDFLPVAEQVGLMESLTSRVLGLALEQCRLWIDQGLDLSVAVNLSPRCLRDARLPEVVFKALDDAGVPAGNLELEITEDALLEDPTQAKAVLEALAEHGVRIVLDDFGSGYSSLAYLSQLPVSKIKIDKAFVTDMDTHPMNEKIVETVLDLGRRLGMEVLAEGVETGEVWQRLVQIGCRQVQGFYVSAPMPAGQVLSWRPGLPGPAGFPGPPGPPGAADVRRLLPVVPDCQPARVASAITN